jgi:hypothetical protein
MEPCERLSQPKSRDPLGTVEIGGRRRGNRSPFRVLVCFAVVLLILGFWVFLVRGVWDVWGLAGVVGSVLATVIYLLFGYAIHPQPVTSNLGFWPFPAPFRPMAKFNVLLLYIRVVLWPGRFVSESLVDMVRLVAYALQPRRNGAKVRDSESKY